MTFPLGTPTRHFSDALSRDERERLLTHNSDGSRRRFRRGRPEPALQPVDLSDLLSPSGHKQLAEDANWHQVHHQIHTGHPK